MITLHNNDDNIFRYRLGRGIVKGPDLVQLQKFHRAVLCNECEDFLPDTGKGTEADIDIETRTGIDDIIDKEGEEQINWIDPLHAHAQSHLHSQSVEPSLSFPTSKQEALQPTTDAEWARSSNGAWCVIELCIEDCCDIPHLVVH